MTVSVETLLTAYSGARIAWIHGERENPTPEYADMIRGAVSAENAKLRELIADVHDALRADKVGMFHKLILASMEDDMRELGIEVSE